VWAAGVKASPVGEWLGADSDRAGRVKVEKDLSVPGHPNIFVIGDAAAVTGVDGKPLPGVAPVAKQQGCYVANLLMARARGRTLPAFRYRDSGSMATIGRRRAVAQIGALKASGLVAWLLWNLAHIYFLIGFRNRFAVAMNWCWNYVTFQRGARLITGILGSRIEDVMPVVSMAPTLTLSAVDSGSDEGIRTLLQRGQPTPVANADWKSKEQVVTAKLNPVDRRPFRSTADHRMEKHLETQYRGLAIPELVAALAPSKERADRSRTVK
jgi:hypothetical protein